MKKSIRRATVNRIKDQMRLKLPYFKIYKITDKDKMEPISGKVYTYFVEPSLSFYIMFVFQPDWEAFHVYIAWSLYNRFPSISTHWLKHPYDLDIDSMKEGIIGLGDFWSPWTHSKSWFLGPKPGMHLDDFRSYSFIIEDDEEQLELAFNNINEVVDEVFNKIVEFAIPFLKKVANCHGHQYEYSNNNK